MAAQADGIVSYEHRSIIGIMSEEPGEVIATSDERAAPPVGTGMYLRKLELRNFRSCCSTSIELQPSLTVLVGENNSGKSNVIDALRLVTTPLGGRRSRYFEEADLSYGHETEAVEISTVLDGLTAIQRAQYITALDVSTMEARYKTVFKLDPEQPRRSRPYVLAGPGGGPDSEPNKREQVCHVYLAPLRDAQRELDSAQSGLLASVIEYLTEPEERDDFVEEANEKLRSLEVHPVVTKTEIRIQEHLHSLTDPVRGQRVGVRFTEHKLRRLVSSLRLKMAESGVDLQHLADSGLGYANLLYIATVLLELQNASENELTLLLVEEPEAHLHPQLQGTLLSYLQEQAESSGHDDLTRPAGRIQVVVTTHSPVIASSVPVEQIVVLRSCDEPISLPDGSEEHTSKSQHVTHAIPVAQLGLSKDETRKIGQYLDATKAALLFGRQMILVEGVSEAVLLPVIGKSIFSGEDEASVRHRRELAALTIINVGSVDFAPYVRLLLTEHDGKSIAEKLVIVTDADPTTGGDDDEPESSGRAERLRSLASEIGSADRLVVCEATYTLEADLIQEAENQELLKDAFLSQKPRSEKTWQSIIDSNNPAQALYDRVRGQSRFLGKGEFAHDVAKLISSGSCFVCPAYLRSALEEVISADVTEERGETQVITAGVEVRAAD